MLTFLTFFLTLTTGLHTVELASTPDVTRVEVLINGIPEAVDDEAPWKLEVDFGGGLRTHELTAVGYDADGEEVARTSLSVNRPSPRAQVRIALLGDERGRVLWDSVEGLEPRAVRLSLDGRSKAVAADGRFILPPFDRGVVHHLVAEVEFAPDLRAEAVLRLGGEFGEGLATTLTALVVTAADGWEPPPAAEMAGWFTFEGEPLTVATVETGGADVLLVRDRAALRPLGDLLYPPRSGGRLSAVRLPDRWLHDGDRFRLVDPVPDGAVGPEARAALFPLTPPLRVDGSEELQELLGRRVVRGKTDPTVPQRLTDAVAAAALEAARGRPRAVVLLTRADTPDRGRHGERATESFLRELQVPLYVWRLGRGEPAHDWSTPLDVPDLGRLRTALEDLGRDLRRQWVVWLEGDVPADRVTASAAVPDGVRVY